MTKKKSAPASALSRPIPQTQWTRARAAERITYPEGVPQRSSWRDPGTYTGGELSYRGQEPRSFVSLAGRAP